MGLGKASSHRRVNTCGTCRCLPATERNIVLERAAYSWGIYPGVSERLHSNLPIPALALQNPKPVTLDGLVLDGDRIVARSPYAIVST